MREKSNFVKLIDMNPSWNYLQSLSSGEIEGLYLEGKRYMALYQNTPGRKNTRISTAKRIFEDVKTIRHNRSVILFIVVVGVLAVISFLTRLISMLLK